MSTLSIQHRQRMLQGRVSAGRVLMRRAVQLVTDETRVYSSANHHLLELERLHGDLAQTLALLDRVTMACEVLNERLPEDARLEPVRQRGGVTGTKSDLKKYPEAAFQPQPMTPPPPPTTTLRGVEAGQVAPDSARRGPLAFTPPSVDPNL